MRDKIEKNANFEAAENRTYAKIWFSFLFTFAFFFLFAPVLALSLSEFTTLSLFIPYVITISLFGLLWKFRVHLPLAVAFHPVSRYGAKKSLMIFLVYFTLQCLFMCFQKGISYRGFHPGMLLSALFIPFQTLTEEVLFRLFPLLLALRLGLEKKSVKWGMVILSGTFFALLHLSNPEAVYEGAMLYYLLWGFFSAFIAIQSGGIEATFALHTANNLFAAVMLTYPDSVLPQTALFTRSSFYTAKELIAFELISFVIISIIVCLTSRGEFNGPEKV
jgi:CAAX amino terminal protease family.